MLMIRFAVALILVVLFPHQSSAQSWLYVTLTPWETYLNSTLVEVPLTSAGLGTPQRQISLPDRAGPAVVTADGRYVVFTIWEGSTTAYTLGIFDRRSGQLATLPGFAPVGNLLADPTALRLLFVGQNEITVIEPTGRRTIAIPANNSLVRPVLSSDGRELFIARSRAVGPGTEHVSHVAVLDPLTGAERRSLPELPPGRIGSIALSHDGQRLFVALNEPLALRVLDAVSGTELLNRGSLANPPSGQEYIGSIHVDDRNNRLFLSDVVIPTLATLIDPSSLYVLDASTLDVIDSSSGRPSIAVDRSLGMVVTVGTGYNIFEACFRKNVNVWATPPAPLAEFTVNLGGCPSLAVATPPDEPTNLTRTVDGRRVTFTWSSVPGVMGYTIEVGSTSGAADLARIPIGDATFDIAGVPPGVYFARVRALNDVGPSAASNEVVVTVQ